MKCITKRIGIVLLATISLFYISCKKNTVVELSQTLDYSESNNWAAKPDTLKKDVDVFFVYPTLFGNNGLMNMDITDVDMRMRVKAVIPKQAYVFKNDCNIFVPYYRQMAMDCLSMDSSTQYPYRSIAINDVKNAFDYYMNKLNNGRPFILAGHSQGSMLLIQLIKDRINTNGFKDKLVAAYIIGYSVCDKDLSQPNFPNIAKAEDDIGVIITYNTQSKSASGSPVLLPGAKCVNPLSWTTSMEPAPKEKNLGAVFFKDNGEFDFCINQYTDAVINSSGALTTSPPDSARFDSGLFGPGIYHKYDYSFYYNNLVENVNIRIDRFLKQ